MFQGHGEGLQHAKHICILDKEVVACSDHSHVVPTARLCSEHPLIFTMNAYHNNEKMKNGSIDSAASLTRLLQKHASEQGGVQLGQGTGMRQAGHCLLQLLQAEPVGLAEHSKGRQELRDSQRIHQACMCAGLPHQRLHARATISQEVILYS